MTNGGANEPIPGGGADDRSAAAGEVTLWRLKRAAGWMRIHVERSRDVDGVRLLCGLWLPYGGDLAVTKDTIERLQRPGTPVCGSCLRALPAWSERTLA